jgi:hypothetical protein
MTIKTRLRKLERVSGKQRLPAFSALRPVGKAIARDTIGRFAIGTNNMKIFVHSTTSPKHPGHQVLADRRTLAAVISGILGEPP